nr:hypothetical protein [Tanacetum cinerariifolium]
VMPPRMRTRSAGRPAAESLRGGTGVWVGRGNDERVDDLNDQGNDQGLGANGGVKEVNENVEGVNEVGNQENVRNQNGNVVNENVQENVKNVLVNGNRNIERYVYGLALQIHEMVAATEPKTIQKAVQIFGALTDEAVRNGSIKKVETRGNVREPSKDKSGRDDNKRNRTGNVFASTKNPIGRENMERNCPNQVVANNKGHGHGNQGNQARGRPFMLGAEEARQDPNIMTVSFSSEVKEE